MINIVDLDHIVLRTTQLQQMIEFYCHVLGCKIERELLDLGLTQLRAGSALIDIVDVDSPLGKKGGAAPNADGRNLDHFCLRIAAKPEADILHHLKQHNVELSDFQQRYGAEGFGRSIYIEDPEKNTVELKFKIETDDNAEE